MFSYPTKRAYQKDSPEQVRIKLSTLGSKSSNGSIKQTSLQPFSHSISTDERLHVHQDQVSSFHSGDFQTSGTLGRYSIGGISDKSQTIRSVSYGKQLSKSKQRVTKEWKSITSKSSNRSMVKQFKQKEKDKQDKAVFITSVSLRDLLIDKIAFKLSEKKCIFRFVNDKIALDQTEPIRYSTGWPSRFSDGLLLCKIIEKIAPSAELINWDDLHIRESYRPEEMIHNINMALNAAHKLGCNLAYKDHSGIIDPRDIYNQRPEIIFHFLSQLLIYDKIQKFDVTKRLDLISLKQEVESIRDFLNCTPLEIFKRWIYFHCQKKINNFTTDIRCNLLVRLLSNLYPELISSEHLNQILNCQTELQKAKIISEVLKALYPTFSLFPQDLLEQSEILNINLLSELFQQRSGLPSVTLCEPHVIYQVSKYSVLKKFPILGSFKAFKQLMRTVEHLIGEHSNANTGKDYRSMYNEQKEKITLLSRSLENTRDNHKQEIADWVEKHEKLRMVMEEYKNLSETKTQNEKSMLSRNKELEQKNNDLSQSISSLKSHNETMIDNLQFEMQTIKKENDSLKKELTNARQNNQSNEVQIQDQITNIQREKSELQNEMIEKETLTQKKLQEYQRQISQLNEICKELKWQNIELEKQASKESSSSTTETLHRQRFNSFAPNAHDSSDLFSQLSQKTKSLEELKTETNFLIHHATLETKIGLLKMKFQSVDVESLKKNISFHGDTKRQSKKNQWKNRYCLLIEDYFLIYLNAEAKSPLEVYKISTNNPRISRTQPPLKSHPFGLDMVFDEGINVSLAFLSEDNCKKWFDKMRKS